MALTPEQIKQGKIKAASLMFASVLTLEMAEEFSKSFLYRHETKSALKRLVTLLEKDLDGGYFDLMQADENLVHGISEKLKELAKQVSVLDIGQICSVSECIPEIISKETNVKLKKLTA